MKAMLLLVAALGQAPAEPPRRVPMPDTCYRAEPGSEVGPFLLSTVGCASRGSLERYARLSRANDRVGMEAMVGGGEAVLIDQGTPLLVIAQHFTPARVEVLTPEQFDARVRAGTPARPAPPVDALEVRAVEGPHRDRSLFVEARSVGLLGLDLVGRRVILGRPGPAGNFPLLSDVAGVHRLRAATSAGNLPVAVSMREQGQLLWVGNDVAATVEASEGGAYRVRLIGGPHKGRPGWVEPAHVRLDSSAAAPTGPAAKGPEDPGARAGRAATLLKAARNLEKGGKARPALENYRRVVAEFGDTPAAKDAAARIKVLAP